MLDKASLSSRLLDLARAATPGHATAPGDPLTVNLRAAGLTSIAAVRLMLDIESTFDVAIPDADLTPENFEDVASIERLVLRLKAPGAH
jgi:acyl carrier protein